ncbi:MAG: NAD(P)-binding domain-containing protein, partial [Hyphomicrobiaceae bacterium]
MTNTGTLGFIGLGVMGEPICRNIMHASSGAMIAFDIRPEPLRRLQSEGARIVSSIGEVAGHADIIFLSLPGGAEVEETVLGDGGLLANGRSGQVVV